MSILIERRSTNEKQLQGGAGQTPAHDSAEKHVSGSARYVDDLPEPRDLLHINVARSEVAHGRISRFDVESVKEQPGVVCVLTAADIPGVNDASPLAGDDPVFADDIISFCGQSLFAVVAESRQAAIDATSAARIEYEILPAILDIDAALEAESWIETPVTLSRGDSDTALRQAKHRLHGCFYLGGQEHFYLEGQVSMALPREDGDLLIYCSTQHPSEMQHNIARMLGYADHRVTVEIRRMGGGFGGKESQSSLFANIAALATWRTGRASKLRLDRDDDMIMTGKRHDFKIWYDVGFDAGGRIEGLRIDFASRCGMSADLSAAINDRTMFHADNVYYLPNIDIVSWRCKTHTVSNTAFRGFGGPQGMIGIEQVIADIACRLHRDPLAVRRANLYGKDNRNITPYEMVLEDNVAAEIINQLEAESAYQQRRLEIRQFNQRSPVLKKGIALTPVKFGISFTATHLNQAGALVQVYSDGSVSLNHGGTEMGQGLFTKVAQVVASTFQIDLARIRITPTSTEKVPNTSATAASSGSDLNGMAARAAALQIRDRLKKVAALHFSVDVNDVSFSDNEVSAGQRRLSFDELVKMAYMQRVSLSAAGFYRTPEIRFDKTSRKGMPFYYFAYGAAVSEVIIDSLTGEYQVLRTDIRHDVGDSLNPAIDMGQIEGGFIQGMGWLTTEELWWTKDGRLATHAPSTYKIPTAFDRPKRFNIKIHRGQNVKPTIYRSKAVGEPPLMLAISVLHAIRDAIGSLSHYRQPVRLDAPATPERVLFACDHQRSAT